MISVAVGWAVSMKSEAVAYAAHAGDHTIYPDCREEFAAALDKAAFRAKKISRHALDGGNVNERVRRIGTGQVFIWQHFRVVWVAFFKILAPESLAIYLIYLVKFEARLRFKACQCSDSLRG